MTKRRIVLPDGRYLIYYGFEGQELLRPDPSVDAPEAKNKKRAVDAASKRRKGR